MPASLYGHGFSLSLQRHLRHRLRLRPREERPQPRERQGHDRLICSAEGQTALAAAQQGTLRYTNAGYTAPEGAWLQSSDEIKWVDRDVEYLTANKDAILKYWNNLLAEVQG